MISGSKILKRGVFLFLGILILIIAIQTIGIEEIPKAILTIPSHMIIFSVLLLIASFLLKIARWVNIYREIRPIDATKIFCIGQTTNLVAPLGTGEVTRAVIAKGKYRQRMGGILASALVEKVIEISFLVCVGIVYVVVFLPIGTFYLQLVLPAILILLCYLAILRPSSLNRLVKITDRLKGKKLVGYVFSKMHHGISSVQTTLFGFQKKRGMLLETMGFTLIIWFLEASGQYMIVHGMGFTVNFLEFLMIFCASWAIGIFSFLPGGLGSRELAFSYFLSLVGVPFATAMSAALVYRIIISLRTGLAGIIAFSTLPVTEKEIDVKT